MCKTWGFGYSRLAIYPATPGINMYKQGGLSKPPYILPFLVCPQCTTLVVCVVVYIVLVFLFLFFFFVCTVSCTYIYIYWIIYNSDVLSSYSPVLYQLRRLSLESPCHCNLIALLVCPHSTSVVNVGEVIQVFFFFFFFFFF